MLSKEKNQNGQLKKSYFIIMLSVHHFSDGLNYLMELKKVCLKNHIGQKQIIQRNYVVK